MCFSSWKLVLISENKEILNALQTHNFKDQYINVKFFLEIRKSFLESSLISRKKRKTNTPQNYIETCLNYIFYIFIASILLESWNYSIYIERHLLSTQLLILAICEISYTEKCKAMSYSSTIGKPRPCLTMISYSVPRLFLWVHACSFGIKLRE